MPKSLISALLGMLIGLTAMIVIIAGVVVYRYTRPGEVAAATQITRVLRATPTAFITANPGTSQPPSPTPFGSTSWPTTTPGFGSTLVPPVQANTCNVPAQMTIALLGVDERPGEAGLPTRTDAIVLVRLDATTLTAHMLSIPRDLYVPLPNLEAQGITQSRINTAYLYGEVYEVDGGGPAEFKETVEWNFGVPVERYVLVNFNAFVSFVDTLGGIDVDVPEAIYDPQFPTEDGGTMVFELPAGQQHLDGTTALRYARTRHQDSDYGRMHRQQAVLLALYERVLSPDIIPQIPTLMQAMFSAVKTDLSLDEMVSLACLGTLIDRNNIATYAIDGPYIIPWTTPTGGSVIIPNREALAPIIDAFLGR